MEIEKITWSRRNFLQLMGTSAALSTVGISCSSLKKQKKIAGLDFNSKSDDVNLTEGLISKLLIKEGDALSESFSFGANNDYINLYQFADGRMALWVNHESISPILFNGRTAKAPLNFAMLKSERDQVGGSFFEIKQNKEGSWNYVAASELNFKLSANTPIPLSEPILGSKVALGTLANCSGGHTPWGTVLTCEENYDHFYGESVIGKNGKRVLKHSRFSLKWSDIDPQPPEHYGWVVEVNPKQKTAQKIIPLGRFAHECATVTVSKDGFPVVYTGDDSNNQCLYKFISSSKNSITNGTLYVADFDNGKWLPLDYKLQPLLEKNFKDQTDVLINCRKASNLIGGSKLDRPEDIEIDPITKAVFVTFTNNKKNGNYHGSIVKLIETDPGALEFSHELFRAGGSKTGFSCPDNLAFDKNGNLWITSDISGSSIGKKPYIEFGNNGLFVVPRKGDHAGEVLKLASAPNDAEFTGLYFSPDQKTMFLSVQHPGENTKTPGKYTSNWPRKGKSKPLSAVITIQGPTLEAFTQ